EVEVRMRAQLRVQRELGGRESRGAERNPRLSVGALDLVEVTEPDPLRQIDRNEDEIGLRAQELGELEVPRRDPVDPREARAERLSDELPKLLIRVDDERAKLGHPLTARLTEQGDQSVDQVYLGARRSEIDRQRRPIAHARFEHQSDLLGSELDRSSRRSP